jgi:hypothetical protein
MSRSVLPCLAVLQNTGEELNCASAIRILSAETAIPVLGFIISVRVYPLRVCGEYHATETIHDVGPQNPAQVEDEVV